MPRRPISVQYALSAQRREQENRKLEEASKTARYYDTHSKRLQHYQAWTTDAYYEKAQKAVEKLASKKEKDRKLEERRKKLKLMLDKENLEYEQEMKAMQAKPKLYQNGYISNPSANLNELNTGIVEKQNDLQKSQDFLMNFHKSRIDSAVMEEAEQRMRNGKPKQAWIDQIAEKNVEDRKKDNNKRDHLKNQGERIKEEIKLNMDILKEKKDNMEDLKSKVIQEMKRYKDLEHRQGTLSANIEKYGQLLEAIDKITNERKQRMEGSKLVETKVKLGMHTYALKTMHVQRMKSIEIDVEILEKLDACMKKSSLEQKLQGEVNSMLVRARQEIKSRYEMECERKECMQYMYDGEARQLYVGQVKIWSLEQQSRDVIMQQVVNCLTQAVTSLIQRHESERGYNLRERESALLALEKATDDEKAQKEHELASEKSRMAELQASLKSVRLKEKAMDKREKEEEDRKKMGHEEKNKRKVLLDKNRASRFPFF